MQYRGSQGQKERLKVAPGVWAHVDKRNADTLMCGALFAFLIGVAGGLSVTSFIEPNDANAAWILFCVGYGGFGAVGMMVGLVIGSIRTGPQNNTGESK